MSLVIKILQYGKTDVSEGIAINKTSGSKERMLCHYWFLKIFDLNFNSMFVINIMMY